ncbi:MAG: membrane protein insertase YidC [Thermodesulfobacteriota bacterium]|nr:membrane protein insertase YidC [Thermodesulfobacteriota bacterium]
MEKRVLLALVLSFAILIVWQVLVINKMPQEKPETEVSEFEPLVAKSEEEPAIKEVPAKAEVSTSSLLLDPEKVKEIDVVVDMPLYNAVFTTNGGGLKSFQLKEYRENLTLESPLIDLITEKSKKTIPLSSYFTRNGMVVLENLLYQCDKKRIWGEKEGKETLTFFQELKGGMRVEKIYTFSPDTYLIECELRLKGEEETRYGLKAELSWAWGKAPYTKEDRYSHTGLVFLKDSKINHKKVDDIEEEPTIEDGIQWAGSEDKYFLSAIIPPEDSKSTLRVIKGESNSKAHIVFSSHMTGLGEHAVSRYKIYLGSKDYEILKKAGHDLAKVINFGWVDIIAKPLLVFLRFVNQYLHNYGLAIIFLTVVIKIAFIPLTHTSYKSMKEMQKLQPKMTEIREKYKDDKEKLNKEIMELYKNNKINPLSGCLPILLQLPVFIALYKVLMGSIELRHAPFFLWIQDLSAKDPYYVTPILMGGSMFLQQKLTPTAMDPMQAKMMLVLPAVFTLMFLSFPSGLVIYWFVSNLLSIFQQFYIHRQFGG